MEYNEYLIVNCTQEEIDKLNKADTNIDWYPDDITSNDVCVYGTSSDLQEALKIIGRQIKIGDK